MQQNLTWQCAHFSELSAAQLYAILSMRSEVFIVEQNCVYQDIDGADIDCMHLIGWTSDQQVAAYMRIVPPGLKFAEVSLGRVITSNAARGTGIGKQFLSGIGESKINKLLGRPGRFADGVEVELAGKWVFAAARIVGGR